MTTGSSALGLLRGLVAMPAAVVSRAGGAVVERVVDRALSGQLVETVSRDIVRYSVIERATQPLAEAGLAEEIAIRIIEGPEFERILARLLESEELWMVVEQIARSPAVTDAISHQGIGFADQVAGAVRGRSRTADDRVERVARRLLHRRPSGDAETP
jgi:hypothetical protein